VVHLNHKRVAVVERVSRGDVETIPHEIQKYRVSETPVEHVE